MKLSKNFTLKELTVTNTGLPNNPGKHEIENLIELINHVLQPLRDIYGYPIHVNSGFRCKAVNQKVGGEPTSQHIAGEAADISSENNARLFHIIREKLVFDQLIWEYGDDNQPAWVHVSYKSHGNRFEVLKRENGK